MKTKRIALALAAALCLSLVLAPVASAVTVTRYAISQEEWNRLAQAHGYRPTTTVSKPAPAPTPAAPPATPATPSAPINPPAPQPSGQVSATSLELQMVDLINQVRAKNGLKPLNVNAKLMELARLKSQDMADNGYFDHKSPTYGYVFDMLGKAGVRFRGAGENIALAGSVTGAMNAFINSPTHRANILMAGWTDVGVGIMPGARGTLVVTQIFIAK